MDLFNHIKQQLSILTLVSDYVVLRQIGNYWKGSCPFHAETDASFTISPEKGIFYCFGCHTSGDVIGFFAKLENVSQIEAAKMLVEQYQIVVPQDVLVQNFSKKTETGISHFEVCKVVAGWLHKELLKSTKAQEYVATRAISSKIIELFMIGYFPGGVASVNRLVKECSKEGILADDLIHVGIVAEGKSVLYSGFEERIIFPIKDSLGRFCGFGGRIFREGEDRAKYYNSKESDGFLKGKLLFGFDVAKKVMQQERAAFLVEGYVDCVAMVQHGFENTVATLGTACTIDHLKTLSRCINTLYLLYDGDKAGVNAILRIAQLCWEVNLEVYVVVLPIKEDPASFLQKGGDLKPLIAQAKNIFAFFIDVVAQGFTQKTLSEKMILAKKIVDLVVKINDAFKQDLLLQQAAAAMQMSVDSLKSMLKEGRQENRRNEEYGAKKVQVSAPKIEENEGDGKGDVSLLEEKIFSAILNSVAKGPERLEIDPVMVEYLSVKVRNLLYHLQNTMQSSKNDGSLFTHYLESLDESDRQWVIQTSLKFEEEVPRELFEQLLTRFYKNNWKYIISDIKRKIFLATQEKNTEKQNTLMEQFLKLKQDMQSRGLV